LSKLLEIHVIIFVCHLYRFYDKFEIEKT